MFEPSHCPWSGCRMHRAPAPGFYQRWGTYQPDCRARPVPRFRCRECRRTFSRQSFHHSYRDRKPHLNPRVLEGLLAGVGVRELARRLPLSRQRIVAKLKKLKATLRAVHLDREALLAGDACAVAERGVRTRKGRRAQGAVRR